MNDILIGFVVSQIMEFLKNHPNVPFIQPGMVGPIRTSVTVMVALLQVLTAYLDGPEKLTHPTTQTAIQLVLSTLSSVVMAHLTYKGAIKAPEQAGG